MGKGHFAVTEIPTYAIIPTFNRPAVLMDCIDSIKDQVDSVFIINNGQSADMRRFILRPKISYVHWNLRPPNIQKFWNLGLDTVYASSINGIEFNSLILNDDIIAPPNLVRTLSNQMRATSAVLAYPAQHGQTEECLFTVAEPIDLADRITGYAFMLRGESAIQLDERFGWWYGDDDLDWRCRQAGGSLLVPGCAVEHRFPNALTNANSDLVAQTSLDRAAFIEKWGRAPH